MAGEAVVIDLNATGTWISENSGGRRTVGQLAQDLVNLCEIPEQAEMVQRDLAEGLAELAKHGLVAQA